MDAAWTSVNILEFEAISSLKLKMINIPIIPYDAPFLHKAMYMYQSFVKSPCQAVACSLVNSSLLCAGTIQLIWSGLEVGCEGLKTIEQFISDFYGRC